MRAFLSVLLTVWLTQLVSHPAFAEKRVRPDGKTMSLTKFARAAVKIASAISDVRSWGQSRPSPVAD
jgi:hypothetical protein